MARSRGANAIMAFAFETTYGTPPGTGFRQVPFTSFNLGEEQNLLENDVLGFGREPLPPTFDVINNDGDCVVPVDVRNIGNWLKLLMGQPADTTVSSDKQHVFTSGATVLPSASIEIGRPEVPSYGMNYGVRANTMRVSMQRSGLLTATFGLVGQGETKTTTSSAGTLATTTIDRFSPFQGAVTRNGATLGNVVSGEFTYSNNLDKVEVIRGDGRIADADPGMVDVSGSITVRFADTTLLDQAQANTPCALQFGWAADVHRSLQIAIPAVYLPRAKQPITGPGGIQATFNWRASRDPVTGHAMTATLVNDVTTY